MNFITAMKLNTHNLLNRLLTLSALIPSFYLLWVSILFFPSILQDFVDDFRLESIFILIAVLCGICGFIALVVQLFPRVERHIKIKTLLLALGIVGYVTFFSTIGGISAWKNMYDSLVNTRDIVDSFLVIWPVVGTFILLILNLRILLTRSKTIVQM